MKKIKVLDFEKDIIKKYLDEAEFIKFLDENPELELDYSELKYKELEEDEVETLGEENVIDYLEEISEIIVEQEEEFVVAGLPMVAKLALYYIRECVAYLDMVQEGNLGLIKAEENYNPEKHADIESYKAMWVIREMVIATHTKIQDVQNEFKSFFRSKKEHFEEIQDEESVVDNEDIFLTEKDLLPNIEAIEKREKLAERTIEFSYLKNRLSQRQIDVITNYFGFGTEKRYSIFEIEEKLKLESGVGEKIFEQALFILSTIEGKFFL